MIVRAATCGDAAAAIAGIYAPYVASSAISFEVEAPTVEDMRGRIAGEDGLYPLMVAHNDDDGGGILRRNYNRSWWIADRRLRALHQEIHAGMIGQACGG